MQESEARELLDAERARLERIRRVLLEECAEAEPGEETFRELSVLDQHPADIGTEVFEREKAESLMSRVVNDLADVDDALRRLDRHEYGTCRTCGQPIADERLRAVPATRFCKAHQTYWEASRIVLTAPAGPVRGERGVRIEDLTALAALFNLDLLPRDDDLVDELELGPEESALHVEHFGGRLGGEAMTGDQIEAAEAAADEAEQCEREQAEQEGY